MPPEAERPLHLLRHRHFWALYGARVVVHTHSAPAVLPPATQPFVRTARPHPRGLRGTPVRRRCLCSGRLDLRYYRRSSSRCAALSGPNSWVGLLAEKKLGPVPLASAGAGCCLTASAARLAGRSAAADACVRRGGESSEGADAPLCCCCGGEAPIPFRCQGRGINVVVTPAGQASSSGTAGARRAGPRVGGTAGDERSAHPRQSWHRPELHCHLAHGGACTASCVCVCAPAQAEEARQGIITSARALDCRAALLLLQELLSAAR